MTVTSVHICHRPPDSTGQDESNDSLPSFWRRVHSLLLDASEASFQLGTSGTGFLHYGGLVDS